jgi:formylglycine-generating enzyme required for sulfatase activity
MPVRPLTRAVAPLAAVVLVGLITPAACMTFSGLVADGTTPDAASDLDGGATDASLGNDASSEPDTQAAADSGAPEDAGPDVYIEPDAAFVCPVGRGPVMVKVGTYCIDGTEVTNAHYEAFLAQATAGTLNSLPAACGFKTSLVPGNWPQAVAKANRPVAYVDWCDAYAYCKYAGKRLCGAITGGAVPVSQFSDASASQWFNACSNNGTLTYPYGNVHDPQKCNGSERNLDSGLTIDVATAPCIGGFPGIYDMSGNIEEWEDSCVANVGATDDCRCRGGAADDALNGLRCERNVDFPRNYRSSHKGIRCCSP